ncbi:MAG: hypothetical protein AVDCRST_MAG88-1119 [uncultured Thermomicrobiales bacterium]|uniref:Uncharacterized protein n=1 Tax=uncultured Thermomicrobiales bacterium TaxID=1645740 RepID=A0A6J4UP33_9BACT|nr:MAG: hypothetical protein AVDCRST_MAG88-1119 [uncultured Thermomicrobiales bacterium]
MYHTAIPGTSYPYSQNEADADALRLRLAEVDVPAVLVVAGQDAAEPIRATETTSEAHRPVQGLWWRLRRVFGGA